MAHRFVALSLELHRASKLISTGHRCSRVYAMSYLDHLRLADLCAHGNIEVPGEGRLVDGCCNGENPEIEAKPC